MTVMDHDISALASQQQPALPVHLKASRGWARVVMIAGIAASLFVFGFAVFTAVVMRQAPPITEHADGIIVLTGGDYRILEGARLLMAGQADRLLISGVNAQTTRDDLLRLTGLDPKSFDCCVELGYSAQDTVGNAEESRAWAHGRHLARLIVVTSNYHMPRSLAELAIAMPGVELIPHTVVPRKMRDRAWWVQPMAARLLLSEYVKFLPVAARLQVMRYLWPSAAPDQHRASRPVDPRPGEPTAPSHS
jgi:uncharacterized SAM-binding protein YcdF (DUF218 family)